MGAQVRVVDNKGTISTIPINWTRVTGTTKDIYNTDLGNVGVGIVKPMATFHNSGSTILGAKAGNTTLSSSAALIYADYTVFNYSASTSGVTLSLPATMTDATAGRLITITNTGTTNGFDVSFSAGAVVTLPVGYAQSFVWNGTVWTPQSSPVALSVPISGLTAATKNNSIDNTNYTQTWNWSTATTQSPLALSAPALTDGNLLSISGGAASMIGNLLKVNGASTYYGNAGVWFNFSGDHIGHGFYLSDMTTKGNAMRIWAENVTTGNALNITGGSALTTGSLINATAAVAATTTKGLLNIANTAASTTGTVATIQANSTAGSGLTVLANGNVGVGTSAPTAALHLQAGTATAGTAPLKLSSGANLTTAESGAVEFDGSHFYGTAGTNRLTLDNSALTGIAGGAAQAQTVDNSISALTKGMTVTWVPTASNTAADPTLAVGTATATTVKKSGTASLAANDIALGVAATAVYDGTNWQLQNPQSATAWSLTGNGGTTAATNFMGTTDDKDVVFKRNGILAGLLNLSSSNTSWGVDAFNTTATGTYNSVFGYQALKSLTSGNGNSAFGRRALTNNTTGYGNLAVGSQALQSNTTGSSNTAVGQGALFNTTTGSNNIAIGANAQVLTTTNDNQLSIGNSIYGLGMGTATPKIGIGLNAPTAALHLLAGTASAGTAPLKLTSSGTAVLLTTPETGAIEFDGTHLYCTIGTTRYQLDQQNSISGEIKIWAGTTTATTLPAGWLVCDGSAISRTTYANLFLVLGTTYGAGDGSTTFNLPNLKGRVPVGYDGSQTEFNALNKTGGEKTHTLTIAEMPSHNHYNGNGGYNVLLSYGGGANTTDGLDNTGGEPDVHNFGYEQNAGGGQAHNNLQPYIVLNYIIKY
ncbi:tail fiber protein [Paludibacter propionicigenes]|nr:tail fiber protein [Paludibacter propionicigenes]